jgi:hypothetical protein
VFLELQMIIRLYQSLENLNGLFHSEIRYVVNSWNNNFPQPFSESLAFFAYYYFRPNTVLIPPSFTGLSIQFHHPKGTVYVDVRDYLKSIGIICEYGN